MKSQTPGVGQAYLGGYTDGNGDWLDGARDYTVHVPADPPAKLFWSFTVYDVRHPLPDRQRAATRRPRLPRPRPRGQRRRLGRPLLRAYRAGREGVQLGPNHPGRHWFSYFRFYGPLEPYFDRSWKLGDITPA